MHTYPSETVATSDFSRLEDIAAAALQAGRRAAAALCALPSDTSLRAKEVLHFVRLLTTERLFEDLSMAALDDLEGHLHRLVQSQAYYAAPYGWYEADGDLTPDRHLTDLGRQLEHVRGAIAETLRLARYMHDLATAEKVVGRARGLTA